MYTSQKMVSMLHGYKITVISSIKILIRSLTVSNEIRKTVEEMGLDIVCIQEHYAKEGKMLEMTLTVYLRKELIRQ